MCTQQIKINVMEIYKILSYTTSDWLVNITIIKPCKARTPYKDITLPSIDRINFLEFQ